MAEWGTQLRASAQMLRTIESFLVYVQGKMGTNRETKDQQEDGDTDH